jgi:ADP-heptose:LPS heptosyltransferase
MPDGAITATLVIHPGALGDVLQAVPALAALRGLEAGTRLTLAAQPRIAALLEGLGVVDTARSFDGLGLDTLFSSERVPDAVRARLACFDGVVSWFGARADTYPERLRAIVPRTLLAPPVPEGGTTAAVWQYLVATLGEWGIGPPPLLAPLRVPPDWSAEARAALAALGVHPTRAPLIVHPGAGAAWKRWAATLMAQAVDRIARETGCQVLVHEGSADRDAVRQLVELLETPPHMLREPSLLLLAAALAQASAYLGPDSGVSHLAAAVGAPAVILFPAATRDRWAPWSPTALALPMGEQPEDIDRVCEAVTARLGAPAPSSERGPSS